MNNRIEPVLYCNYEKEIVENNKLYSRNFCSFKDKEPVLDFKPNHFICQEYKTIDNFQPRNLNNVIETCGLESYPNNCEPDRGNYLNYLRNIDIDSELRSMNRKNSKCPEDLYLAPSLASSNRHNPNLINKNQRVPYRFNFELEPQQFVRDSVEYKQKVLPDCKRQDLFNTGNCKTFNYDVDLTYNKCATLNSDVDVCGEEYKNIKDPYLFWTKTNECNTNAMRAVVGPIRKDHQCENLFNNSTKRRSITCEKPCAYYTNTAPDFSKNSLVN